MIGLVSAIWEARRAGELKCGTNLFSMRRSPQSAHGGFIFGLTGTFSPSRFLAVLTLGYGIYRFSCSSSSRARFPQTKQMAWTDYSEAFVFSHFVRLLPWRLS